MRKKIGAYKIKKITTKNSLDKGDIFLSILHTPLLGIRHEHDQHHNNN